MSNIPKLKTLLVVVLLITALVVIGYASWYFYPNSSYVADVAACRQINVECSESEAATAKVSYDGMDGIYYVDKLYTLTGKIKLKDFCLLSAEKKYSAICEDNQGVLWNIVLLELRFWSDISNSSKSGTLLYENSELGISLRYPSSWQPTNEYNSWSEIPSGYFGEDGFFLVDVMDGGSNTLEQVALETANHPTLWGKEEKAVAKKVLVQNQEAWLIMPTKPLENYSPDPTGIIKYPQAYLLVKLPEPVMIKSPNYPELSNKTWPILELRADVAHIEYIMKSIEFSTP